MDINNLHPQSGRVVKEDGTTLNLGDLSGASLGQHGSKRITNTSATTPDAGKVFVAIQVTEDCVISSLVGNMANADGATLVVGTILYGRFTSITLTSGKVVAYMGV